MWALLCRSFGWAVADYDRFAQGPPADRVRAAWVDGEPVACARIRDFGQFFGGRSVPMGGYSPVAVAPEFRGRGFGSTVCAVHYPLLRERGLVLSGLYPATNALYRRIGFELAGTWGKLELPTRELQRLPLGRGTPTRRASESDRSAIEACYARVGAELAGLPRSQRELVGTRPRRPRPTDLRRRWHEWCGRRIRAVPIALAADREPRDAAGRRAHGRRTCSRAGALAPGRHVVFDRTHVQDHRTAGPLPAVVAARAGSRRTRRVALDGASHRRARRDRGARLRHRDEPLRVGRASPIRCATGTTARGGSSSKEARAGSRAGVTVRSSSGSVRSPACTRATRRRGVSRRPGSCVRPIPARWTRSQPRSRALTPWMPDFY